MNYLADLHIHSHFSRATSGGCRPEILAATAARKGLQLIGTGDFTHAGWRAELAAALTEAEEGFYRLQEGDGPVCGVRFLVTGEISCIYKQDGRTRKIHHLVLLPDLDAAARVSAALEARGANLRADGRPIIGLDSRTLLALILEASPRAVLIPAHIWTPHFSLFGALSGFDALEECFGDLSGEITAYETGLSSDPPMNWRLSALDRLTLVSNSDAHSPEKLGREANEFEAEFSYPGLAGALRRRKGRVAATVEFFPEEGKYHYDGHRNCGICWHPSETRAAKGICSVCGRPVTVGVLHRAMALADRPEGARPEGASSFSALVSLAQIAGEVLHAGIGSQKVIGLCTRLLDELGPEIPLLLHSELAEVQRIAGSVTAEALRRVRSGEVSFSPGYDGEYGRLTIIRPEERSQLAGQSALFQIPAFSAASKQKLEEYLPDGPKEMAAAATELEDWTLSPLAGLNQEQERAATAATGPVTVTAGPGTGKTRTLIQRLAHLLAWGVSPHRITAITFTHRAAEEMRRRLRAAGGEAGEGVWVGTFHRFCHDLLTAIDQIAPPILDEREAAAVLAQAAGEGKTDLTVLARLISLHKSRWPQTDGDLPGESAVLYRGYQERLAALGVLDYDSLLIAALTALQTREDARAYARERAWHLLVDEFQDINGVQYQLVRELAGDGRRLFVIGDPDQAIYGFRGADHRFFSRLSSDYPFGLQIKLTLNYRSSGHIVRASGSLLGRVEPGIVKAAGPRLRYLSVSGGRVEARAVVREIERLLGGSGMLAADRQSGKRLGRSYSLSEIAVLFRTGRQAEPLEEALLAEGIPYRVLGQRALLGAPEIAEALDALRFVQRPTGLRFLMAVRAVRYKPGVAALRILDRELPPGKDFAPVLQEMLRTGRFLISAHGRIQELLDTAAELRERTAVASAAELLLAAVPRDEREPSRALTQAACAAGDRSLDEFLTRLATGGEGDRERREDSARPGEVVSLLTMHAAKGLEFPAVIVTGLADQTMPWRGGENPDDVEEERRLFYVAMTRAAETLILLGPPLTGENPRASRFVRVLPAELMEVVESGKRKQPLGQQGLF